MLSTKKVYCDITKCLGCKGCELACAVEHSKSKNLLQAINESPLPQQRVSVEQTARLRSSEFEVCLMAEIGNRRQEIGKTYCLLPVAYFVRPSDFGLRTSLPLQCRHCDDALCVSACMSGAMYKANDGSIQHNEEKCVGCWMCIMVCPFGAISHKEKLAIKCDLCKDRNSGQACVDACPTRALKVIEKANESGEYDKTANYEL